MKRLLSLVCLAAMAGTGCALLSKSDSVYVRYFTPEVRDRSETAVAPNAAANNLYVRLGRVNALSYIKDRIAFREADEIGFHDLWQWTEKPESYLRRGMEHALFEEHAVHQIISGPGPTLELELDAFDELPGPRRVARVQVTWLLHDGRNVLVQKTVTVDHLVSGATDAKAPEPLVSAMSVALADVIAEIVAGITPELSRVAAQSAVAETVGSP